jgi:hypothetical protein
MKGTVLLGSKWEIMMAPIREKAQYQTRYEVREMFLLGKEVRKQFF